MRNRTFLESTASEKAKASSGETVIPVGADMVAVEDRQQWLPRDEVERRLDEPGGRDPDVRGKTPVQAPRGDRTLRSACGLVPSLDVCTLAIAPLFSIFDGQQLYRRPAHCVTTVFDNDSRRLFRRWFIAPRSIEAGSVFGCGTSPELSSATPWRTRPMSRIRLTRYMICV